MSHVAIDVSHEESTTSRRRRARRQANAEEAIFLRLSAAATNVELVDGHWEYSFQVAHPGGCSWRVQRRFSEFRTAFDALGTSTPGLPELPDAEGIFPVVTKARALRRVTELQRYLDGVLAHSCTKVACAESVQKVLGVRRPETPTSVQPSRWFLSEAGATTPHEFSAGGAATSSTAGVELVVALAQQILGSDRPVDRLLATVTAGGLVVETARLAGTATGRGLALRLRLEGLPCGEEASIEVRAANAVGESNAAVVWLRVPTPGDGWDGRLARGSRVESSGHVLTELVVVRQEPEEAFGDVLHGVASSAANGVVHSLGESCASALNLAPTAPAADMEQPERGRERVAFNDPRWDDGGGGLLAGVLGFPYMGSGEALDALCASAFLGNSWEMGADALKVSALGDAASKPFSNAEAAYQALKFWVAAHWFRSLAGEEAVLLKSQLQGTEDWSLGGYASSWNAMRAVLAAKFTPGTPLARALADTGDAFLLAHNSEAGCDRIWSDNESGDGSNWLGMQLLLRRDDLRSADDVDARTWTQHIRDHCGIDLATGQALGGAVSKRWQSTVQAARDALVAALEGRCDADDGGDGLTSPAVDIEILRGVLSSSALAATPSAVAAAPSTDALPQAAEEGEAEVVAEAAGGDEVGAELSDSGFVHYTLKLQRPSRKTPLGILVKVKHRIFLKITAFKDKGVFHDYNEASPESARVRVDDLIASVNGVEGSAEAMLMRMTEATSLVLALRRKDRGARPERSREYREARRARRSSRGQEH